MSIHEEMHFNINSSECETQTKPCAIIDLEAMSPRDQTIAKEMAEIFPAVIKVLKTTVNHISHILINKRYC